MAQIIGWAILIIILTAISPVVFIVGYMAYRHFIRGVRVLWRGYRDSDLVIVREKMRYFDESEIIRQLTAREFSAWLAILDSVPPKQASVAPETPVQSF